MGGLSVVMGAISSHLLVTSIQDAQVESFSTAVRFHIIHSVVLIITSIINDLTNGHRALSVSVWFFFTGMVIFCGSLYMISLTGYKVFGVAAPLGAVLLIIAWSLLAFGIIKTKEPFKNGKAN